MKTGGRPRCRPSRGEKTDCRNPRSIFRDAYSVAPSASSFSRSNLGQPHFFAAQSTTKGTTIAVMTTAAPI